jgi:hypothetical protein
LTNDNSLKNSFYKKLANRSVVTRVARPFVTADAASETSAAVTTVATASGRAAAFIDLFELGDVFDVFPIKATR